MMELGTEKPQSASGALEASWGAHNPRLVMGWVACGGFLNEEPGHHPLAQSVPRLCLWSLYKLFPSLGLIVLSVKWDSSDLNLCSSLHVLSC